MTQFDDNIRQEFLKDEPIPTVVTDKWDAAAAEIRAGNMRQKKATANKVISIGLKSMGGVAAAFALLFSVAYVNPAFAESIPVLRDVVHYFKNNDTKTYVPAVATAPEVAENIQPVTPVQKETALSIEEAYCDGNVLVFSMILEPGAAAADYDLIGVNPTLTLNGTDASKNMLCYGLQKTEDGAYVGLCTVDVAGMGLTDTIDMALSLNEANYITNHYVLSGYDDMLAQLGSEEAVVAAINALSPRERINQVTWEQQYEPVALPEGLSFTGTVPVDTSKVKVYEVNAEENGCAVRSLTASPTSTKVDLTLPENTTYVLTDNMGNKIEWLKLGSYDWSNYDALLNGTTAVTVSFYSMDNENTPIAQFEIPVEGGFVEKEDLEPKWATRDESKYTYTPTLAPLPADWLNRSPEDTIIPLGETFTLVQNDDANEGAPCLKQEITYSNMQVFDSMEDASLDESGINSSFVDGLHDTAGKKFITLDLHIKNLEGPQDGLYIGDYGWLDQKQPGLANDTQPINELVYFSDAGQGVSDFYYSDIQFDEEYNGTIGFYWDAADLKAGNLQLTMVRYENNEPVYTILDFPPYEG